MKMEETLLTGARELGVEISSSQVAIFLEYLKNLEFWGRRINLTGIRDEREIIISHFLDSISLAPFISNDSRLLDIGSGAGLPGIPLKIVIPSLEVTLLDSVGKKVFFMREVIRKLQLRGIVAVCGRAEDSNNEVARGQFDFVVSRAVGKIERLAELAIPYLRREGKIVLMRGKRGFEEWDQTRDRATNKLKLLESKEISLPFEKQQRIILVIECVQ